MFGPVERGHEAIRRVLLADPGHGLLVPEGILRTGDRGRRMDRKSIYMYCREHSC